MEPSRAIIKVLLFLTFSLHLSSAAHHRISMWITRNESIHPGNVSVGDVGFQVNMTPPAVSTEQRLLIKGTHSMYYFDTGVTPGIGFPEYMTYGLMDGEQFDYYDSNNRKYLLKTEWIKKIYADYPDYKNSEIDILHSTEEYFKVRILTLMELFNQTEGVHTYQHMYGCELDDDDTIRGYDDYSYDGENFLSLDLKTATFTAANEQAVPTKLDWEDSGYAAYTKYYLEKECIEWLKLFVSYGRETLERKDRPEVSVFHMRSNSSELVCHATGYFPRGLMIFWENDGKELLKDVEIRATVPNPDGSFQKRAVLRVSPEDQQKHEYTCVVQHSSLEKDLVLKAPGSVDPDEGSLGAGPIVGIVLAVVTGVALVVVVGVLIWKTKKKPAIRTRSSPFISESSDSSEVSSSE